MQGDQTIVTPLRRKAFSKARFQLWREVDLRHHDQHLCRGVLFQLRLRGAQIHLGFTAAGVAVKQEGAGLCGHSTQGFVLLFGELGQGGALCGCV